MSLSGQKLLEIFRAEHREHAQQIRLLIDRIQQEESPGDELDEAFRRAHSLKGAARAVSIGEIERLGHGLETLFARVRAGELRLDETVAAVVHDALDCSEDILAGVGGAAGSPATAEALASIQRALAGEAPAEPPAPAPRQAAKSGEEAEDGRDRQVASVRLQAAHVARLLRTCEQLLATVSRHEALTRSARDLSRELDNLESHWTRLRSTAQSQPRRPAEAFETRLRQAPAAARRLLREQQRNAAVIRRLTSQLRRDVWQARSTTAESAFEGLGAMVRSLARSEGKQVRFRAAGLDAEADREVLQAVRDPVIHLLRNAVSHGIETPAERERAGKPAAGLATLALEAAGGFLTVRVSDDGRGIDYSLAAREAVRRGLLAEQADPSQQEASLRRLLFSPGFSTAAAVSEIAGRGIGLSVVEQTVRRLQGEIETLSEPGRGATMVVRVPLSAVTQRVLLASAGGRVLALPLRSIERVMRAAAASLETVAGQMCLRSGETALRIVSLAAALGLAPSAARIGTPLAVVRHGSSRAALLVDELLEEREAFVESLNVPGSAGGLAVGGIPLENGSAAIALSVPELLRAAELAAAGSPLEETPAPREEPKRRILLADDSLTTRALEKGILEVHGYDVMTAVDGAEALEMLRAQGADLVISDVQMPRLDGFGLVQAMKDDKRLCRIPVVMLTSMESPSDQEKGMALGVDAYIVKRKFDQHELLETIRQIL